MVYKIRTLSGNNIIINETVENVNDIKKIIENKYGTPINFQRLLYNGKILNDLPPNNSIIYLVYKLLGG